jgi:serine/threonine protein kinase
MGGGTPEMRSSIFISYSHRDEEWRQKFVTTLNIAAHKADFEVWSDKRIPIGSEWYKEIEKSIVRSRIALLLVSNHFVESQFIQTEELRKLIQLLRHKTVQIFWVPIEKLSEYRLSNIGLKSLEAASSIDRPLSEMSNEESRDAIDDICNKLTLALGLAADTGPEAGNRLMKAARDLVEPEFKIAGPIATGDFSVLFDAERKRDGRRVVVKTLVASHRREWLGKDFVKRAQLVQNVQHSSLIKVIDVFPSDTESGEQCDSVVSDYVDAPTLESVLKNSPNGRLSSGEVANILHQLAQGCVELHGAAEAGGKMLLMGPLRPANVFRDRAGKVRVSPVQISHETMETCQYRPALLLEDEALTYLSPERYEGKKPGTASDQYHLALLGLELLTGGPPVTAKTFSDLTKKEKFFDRPYDFFDGLRTGDPALSFVLAKMLERDPEKRWPSMHDASTALDRVSQRKLPDELRSTAKALYQKHVRGTHEFYRSFYEILIERSPRARQLISCVELDTQCQKLDNAMDLLLTFRAEDEPTTLLKHANEHVQYKLQSSDFDAFQNAFLETLARLLGKEEPYATDAWRAILIAGVSYMADRAAVRTRAISAR